jgi:integrase
MPYRDKVYKKKWRAQVRRSGVKKTQLCDTRAEAVKWEVDQKGIPLNEFLNGTPTVFSLAEWAEEYLTFAREKFSKKSYDEKRLALREFFKTVNPKLEPTMLTSIVVLKHFNAQAKGRSGYAANKDRKNLIAGWNWAIKYISGWPKENPFAGTDKQPAVESPRYIPPLEDFWKVYDWLPAGQDKVMLFTFLHTAARRGELFALKWNEVDFSKKRLKLWTRKRRGGNLEFDWVPMTDELVEKLHWWYENRTFPDTENVFVCESQVPCQGDLRGKPFMFRQRWMKEICARAGVEHFGIHAIRHLSASSLDDAGYPITIIQGILRHKNANTTAKYLHKLRGMRVALDDAFRRPQPKAALAENETGRSFPDKANRPSFRVLQGGKAPQKAPHVI